MLTLSGRIVVPFLVGGYQAERLGYPKGQSDLIRRQDGKWFLLVTVDVPDGTEVPATDFLGVDMGIVNIAADSDGEIHSSKAVEDVRQAQPPEATTPEEGDQGSQEEIEPGLEAGGPLPPPPEPRHLQEDRRDCQTHRARCRRRRPRRHPRTGYGPRHRRPQQALRLVVRPTLCLPGLQSPTGGDHGRDRGSQEHQSHVCRVWALPEVPPEEPGGIRMQGVRPSGPCRPKRRPEYPGSGTC